MFRKMLLCGLAMSALVAADAPSDLAAKFGAMESVKDISLSADGSKVAYLSARGNMGNALYIADLANPEPKMVFAADGQPLRLEWCNWVSDVRLACLVTSSQKGAGKDTKFINASRFVAVNADGSDVKLLSQRSGSEAIYFTGYGGSVIDWLSDEKGSLLMTRWIIPEVKATSVAPVAHGEGLAVERIDTTTLKRTIVEPARRDAAEYISDQHGAVRIIGTRAVGPAGYSQPVIKYFYRTTSSRELKPLATYNVDTDEGFNPIAVDRDKNVVFGFRKLDGRQALYSISLDDALTQTLILSNPRVDIDGLVRVGRDHHVVGASFVEDKRQNIYFDKDILAMSKALSRALPGNPAVYVSDTSADGTKFLIWAGSDVDPGAYYLFDKTAKRLNKILLSRNELADVKLAEVKAIEYPAADGTMIPAYLTMPVGSAGKNLPAIVMPHGGPTSRDEWGFDWLSQYYAARGYAVVQPNYRGSSGFGDNWLKGNGFRSWKTAIGDVIDAGKWLVTSGIADPQKLAIVGWSYGGYAALQSAVVSPGTFKAVVAVAPVTDIQLLTEQYRYNGAFRSVQEMMAGGDDIRAGSPAQNASAIQAPVLMFQGDMDQNVYVEQARLMADKLKSAGKNYLYVEYPGLAHSLQSNVSRTDLLKRSDAFLREQMGMK